MTIWQQFRHAQQTLFEAGAMPLFSTCRAYMLTHLVFWQGRSWRCFFLELFGAEPFVTTNLSSLEIGSHVFLSAVAMHKDIMRQMWLVTESVARFQVQYGLDAERQAHEEELHQQPYPFLLISPITWIWFLNKKQNILYPSIFMATHPLSTRRERERELFM